MYLLLKMVIFHCHVSLLEGTGDEVKFTAPVTGPRLVFSSTSVRLAQATPVTVDDPAPGGPQVFAMDADDSSR